MENIFNNIIMLGVLAAVLYIAYRIGAFVLKIAIGLAVLGFLVFGANRIWSCIAGHFV